MPASKRKIINDPVYGFITVQHPVIFAILEHPHYQRLRRIQQMALAQLVYPGAVHTRFHHSLGAYHLMTMAIAELRGKGVDISPEEEVAVQAGILLHDVGHGPYSHALEEILVPGTHHEEISLRIMEKMNQEMQGALTLCLDIFTNRYERKFLHQLISGQLDMDRLDYLSRDSFFSGVSEGVVGYDRILKMLTVHNDQLMVEEKAIYSVEKFLLARRQMYWQVYRHKTVLAAEKMLVRILERVREIYSPQDMALQTGSAIDFFLAQSKIEMDDQALAAFTRLDDVDIMAAIKKWMQHPDAVLGLLCTSLLNRKLYKVKMQHEPIAAEQLAAAQAKALAQWSLGEAALPYLVFIGEASNTTYQESGESIHIRYKDGSVRDIMDTDQSLIGERLLSPMKKFYICTLTP